MSVQELKEERRKLFEDVYNLRIPKRVPVTIKVNNDFGIQYAGMDLIDVQWHPEKQTRFAQTFFLTSCHLAPEGFLHFTLLRIPNILR